MRGSSADDRFNTVPSRSHSSISDSGSENSVTCVTCALPVGQRNNGKQSAVQTQPSDATSDSPTHQLPCLSDQCDNDVKSLAQSETNYATGQRPASSEFSNLRSSQVVSSSFQNLVDSLLRTPPIARPAQLRRRSSTFRHNQTTSEDNVSVNAECPITGCGAAAVADSLSGMLMEFVCAGSHVQPLSTFRPPVTRHRRRRRSTRIKQKLSCIGRRKSYDCSDDTPPESQ
jgi:hypothetical protein